MKMQYLMAIIFAIMFSNSCSNTNISGTVIDSESGNPIEGAVVLVEWTETSGKWTGMSTTKSYKVVEVITDKKGKFAISTVFNPFVDPPRLTVYKKGYVAWNNVYIFPDYRKREENYYQFLFPNITIRMEHFNEKKFNHNDHTLFIHNSINSGLPGTEKKLMGKAIRWEDLKAEEEILKNKK